VSGMGNPTTNTNNPLTRRRSQRVLMQVRVMITGEDAAHKRFEEEAETLAINAHGALILLRTRLTSGGTVTLKNQRTLEDQECHIVFLGPVRGGKCEVGLEFSAARPTFWRIAFPPEDWSPRSPESRTISRGRDNK